MAWWTRTAHNKPGGDLLLNTPDGWVIDKPELKWLGSDQFTELMGQAGKASLDVAAPGNSFPAITRATTLISDPLAGVKWEVKRGRDTLPPPRWVTDPALSRPDGRVSDWLPTGRRPLGPVAWWAQAIVGALWYGDAYIYVPNRAPDGTPVPPLLQIHPLMMFTYHPDDDPERTNPGYFLRVPRSNGVDDWVQIPPHMIIHIPGMPPYNDENGRGRGAITGHLKTWDEAVAQRNYSTSMFTAGIPAGYLKVTAPNLTPIQADELRAGWMEKHGGTGPNARDIAVLNAVTDFVAVQLDPDSLQLTDARQQSTLDVANAFGVEPYMLGLSSDNSTYANIESRMRHFVQFTLLPWARRIEGALDSEFPQGTGLVLDLDSLTRADTGNRVAYYAAGLSEGWLTVDEVRTAEGLPPLPVQEAAPAPPALVPPVD